MKAGSLCQYLDWDSEFFRRRIARITISRLSQESIERILTWCDSQVIDCIYFLADPDDGGTIRLAEDNGFHFADIRVTLERQLDNVVFTEESRFEGSIRLCVPGDVPTLRTIAGVSHRDSRFYYDSHFPRPLCNALYETWIEKSCHGYANAVLVAELQGRPVGYISCHLLDQTTGGIGLLGVSADGQGKGLGQRLVNESLRWFAGRAMERITVVTQGRNCKAQRSYQRCGFLTRSVQLWYHQWFSPAEAKIARVPK